MNFSRGRKTEEPEINLIPMIDILLVVLIFLMVATTYSKPGAIKINLPFASANAPEKNLDQINVDISSSGDIFINAIAFGTDLTQIKLKLIQLTKGMKDPAIICNVDAQTRHQSVVDFMEVAGNAGLTRLSFSTKSNNK